MMGESNRSSPGRSGGDRVLRNIVQRNGSSRVGGRAPWGPLLLGLVSCAGANLGGSGARSASSASGSSPLASASSQGTSTGGGKGSSATSIAASSSGSSSSSA